jgi:hypothetical protein
MKVETSEFHPIPTLVSASAAHWYQSSGTIIVLDGQLETNETIIFGDKFMVTNIEKNDWTC